MTSTVPLLMMLLVVFVVAIVIATADDAEAPSVAADDAALCLSKFRPFENL
jgi:hypothetical protein